MGLSRGRRDLAVGALLLTLVYVSGAGAVTLRPGHSTVATWWPAAAFSVGALLLLPRRRWPWLLGGIVLTTIAANLTGGRGPLVSTLFALSNAAEAGVAAFVITRAAPQERFGLDSPYDFFRLLRGCLLGAATIGVGAGLTVELTTGGGWEAARTVAPSHLAAMLLILPLLVMPGRLRVPHGRLVELAIQAGVLVAVTLAVFSPHQELAVAFLPMPLLIWAALRFEPYVVSVQVLVLGVMTTFLTELGGGPFAVGARSARVDAVLAGSQVQLYLVCAALMALPAALTSAQRAQLLRRLTEERELLSTTLATTASIICVSDREGTVIQANGTTARLTGFDLDELIGRPFWLAGIIPPERRGIVRHMFAEPDGSNVPGAREADVMTKSGERLRVVWNNSVVRDEHGDVTHVVSTGIDVTAERTTTNVLRHLLKAPVATALVGLDPEGRITLVNRGAQELLARGTELIGQDVSAVIASTQPSAYLAHAVPAGLEEGSDRGTPPQTGDWSWLRSDGETLIVSTTISTVTDVFGQISGYLCVGRDVTEQRRTQELLVEALEKERHGMERLRRLDAAKNDFVSTVSHELRTPTTSIVGYTEMLRDGSAGEPTPEQIPMLEAIARNGTRLIAVASDLLTLSELESDDTSMWEREPVDLARLVEQSEEAVRPLLSNRDLAVEFVAPDEAVTVIGDAAHLDRVLMNLLSNAIKFTPDGGRVSLSVEATAKWAKLEISDTGIGIPEDEQGDLFTKFFRSSTAQERAIQGTGLGLSIIDSIVATHGGDIEVRSGHLQGTTFTIKLPLARQSARSAVRSASA